MVIDDGEKDEFLSPPNSTHEYLRSASQSILDKHDLSTPTLLAPVLKKAREMKAFEIYGNREENIKRFPTFEDSFRDAFIKTLSTLVGNRNQTTGMDILRAYEQAAEATAFPLTKQLRSGMYQPLAYGRMLNHFDIPILPKLIGEIAIKNPVAAKKYREQSERWSAGTA